ncbi:MAG: ABC-type sugar transport system periplasmic component-like protein [Solirubrobacterales bacterium]|nr:ABC-type sugar transport system periplasmic component-like protein [Solirubrobacterales bacterium]
MTDRSMGSKWRSALGAVTLGVGVLAIAGCGSNGGGSTTTGGNAAAPNKKPVNVAFVGFANSSNFTQWGFKGAQAAAKKAGATVTLIDGKLDPKAQANAMQNALQSGKFNAIALWPVDAVSMLPVVNQAAAKRIPVVAGDYTFGPVDKQDKLQQIYKSVPSTVGTSLTLHADLMLQNIEAACAAKNGPGKPCKVGLMAGSRQFPPDAVKETHIKSALDKTPNIQAVFTPDGGFAQPSGYKAAQTFLQNNKDVDVINAAGDQMVAGVVQALPQVGLTPGKDVYITGFGGTVEGVQGVKSGQWFATVGLSPQAEGYAMTDLAIKAARGEQVPPIVDVYSLPGTMKQVTKATLAKNPGFAGDWSAVQ